MTPAKVYDDDAKEMVSLEEYRRRKPRSYSPTPPPDMCSCYEWRPWPPPSEHFGYAGWHRGPVEECKHLHHAGKIWIADF